MLLSVMAPKFSSGCEGGKTVGLGAEKCSSLPGTRMPCLILDPFLEMRIEEESEVGKGVSVPISGGWMEVEVFPAIGTPDIGNLNNLNTQRQDTRASAFSLWEAQKSLSSQMDQRNQEC